MVLPAIFNVMDANPNVNILIGGDYEIYNMFDKYPLGRKTFIPPVPYDTYPVMLQMSDIWLAPLEDTVFNRAKSDIKLVDAAAAGIPFLASSLPQYIPWGKEGGSGIASDPKDWQDNLDILVDHPSLRKHLGMVGKKRSGWRESEVYGSLWANILWRILK
jgi:glycosyltransferase involved in cell wall biosynthesis